MLPILLDKATYYTYRESEINLLELQLWIIAGLFVNVLLLLFCLITSNEKKAFVSCIFCFLIMIFSFVFAKGTIDQLEVLNKNSEVKENVTVEKVELIEGIYHCKTKSDTIYVHPIFAQYDLKYPEPPRLEKTKNLDGEFYKLHLNKKPVSITGE